MHATVLAVVVVVVGDVVGVVVDGVVDEVELQAAARPATATNKMGSKRRDIELNVQPDGLEARSSLEEREIPSLNRNLGPLGCMRVSTSTRGASMGPHEEREEYGKAVSPGESPAPGDIIKDGETLIAPEPLVGTGASTPLDDEPESTIPRPVLWVMKDRRHIQWHLLPRHEQHEQLRVTLGHGDETVFAIDDGAHHATIARLVGSAPGNVEYVLVGRIARKGLENLQASSSAKHAFDEASELGLAGVSVDESIESSNIFDVARYGSSVEIPGTYLPGNKVHRFSEDLEITI